MSLTLMVPPGDQRPIMSLYVKSSTEDEPGLSANSGNMGRENRRVKTFTDG